MSVNNSKNSTLFRSHLRKTTHIICALIYNINNKIKEKIKMSSNKMSSGNIFS